MEIKQIKVDYCLPEEGSVVPGETILQLSYIAPPTTYYRNIFQPAYPCDSTKNNEPLYPTFENVDFKWIYIGLQPERQ